MLFSSDCLANTVQDDGLEKEGCWWAAGNIGVLMFRPSAINFTEARGKGFLCLYVGRRAGVQALGHQLGGPGHRPQDLSEVNQEMRLPAHCTQAWVAGLDADPKVWDQSEFNALRTAGGLQGDPGLPGRQSRLFRRAPGTRTPAPQHSHPCDRTHHPTLCVRRGFNGTLRFGVLPIATFASGHTFFTQRMALKLGLQPYVVHATFQFSGTAGKIHRLREASGRWAINAPRRPLVVDAGRQMRSMRRGRSWPYGGPTHPGAPLPHRGGLAWLGRPRDPTRCNARRLTNP